MTKQKDDRALPPETPEPRPRLVVELSRQAHANLEELVAREELNKTTIVNRALNVYYMLRMAEFNGGEISFTESEDGTTKHIRFI